MDTTEIIGIIVFAIGLFILFSIAVKKSSWIPVKSAPLAGVIAVGMIIAGGIYGVMPMLPEDTSEGETTTIIVDDGGGNLQYPEFDITPAAVTTAGTYLNETTLNSGKTMFTVPSWGNATGDTLWDITNNTWYDPRCSFQVVPVPFAGANADDLATFYFTVSNYDAVVDIDDAVDQTLITKSSGEYQVIWTEGSNTWYVEGSKTLLLTGNATMYLDFDVNQAAMANSDMNDMIDLTVTFYNADWSWSKSYTVSFVVQYSW